MVRSTLVSLFFAASLVAAPEMAVSQQQEAGMDLGVSVEVVESGQAEINGLSYYYQIYGEGEPLLLLHGGLGLIEMFAPILPALAEHRQVIGVDLHGHGRTGLGERPIDLVAMGRDMADLVEHLGHDRVDVLGYSMGGGVAAQMAVQRTETVRRLVLVSTPFGMDGFYPDIVRQMQQIGADAASFMQDTPMYRSYVTVAPDPAGFPRLLEAMGALARDSGTYGLEVEALTMPVLLVFGDADMFRLEHVMEFYKRLGGGQGDPGWMREAMPQNRLAILPDTTHYDILDAPTLMPSVLPFLEGDGPAPVWGASGAGD